MKLLLKRVYKRPEYTVGELFIDGSYYCNTLEPTDRYISQTDTLDQVEQKKVPGVTAIPYGEYKIDMDTVSPTFREARWAQVCNGKVPRLVDVKGFEGILIHVGNKVEDTRGCILVGKNGANGHISESTATFTGLCERLMEAHNKVQDITIEIV